MNKKKSDKINSIDVVDHIELEKLVVTMNIFSDKEEYTIFRKDGVEQQIIIRDGVILKDTYKLTKNEIDYFESGYYKKLKKDL